MRIKVPTDAELCLDKFVGELESYYEEVKDFSKYLNLVDEEATVVEDAFNIIKKYIKKMKKSESVPELAKHLKVKKVVAERGEK